MQGNIKDVYNSSAAAHEYDQSRLLPEATTALWQQVLLSVIPSHDVNTILDLGCGTGRFTSILRNCFKGDLIGIDPCKEMLLVAEKRKIPGTTWQLGSADNIPFGNESFDLVFLSQVFHHLADVAGSVIEINRVLGAKRFFAIRNSTREQLQDYEWLEFFPEAREIEARRLPSQGELIQIITQHGFELISHQTIFQLFANSYQDYFEKIRLRGLSSLKMISENAFRKGVDKFRNWVSMQSLQHVIREPVDLFVFTKF